MSTHVNGGDECPRQASIESEARTLIGVGGIQS